MITFSAKEIKNLEILGYRVKSTNPYSFWGGGQYAGGIWEITAEEAKKHLEEAASLNKIWMARFGKKYAEIHE